jgi:hypothetical protein
MLAECSGVGATIEVASVPKPEGVPLDRWLQTFPSFGYLLAVAPAHMPVVLARFAARGIATADIGAITADRRVEIIEGSAAETIWDFAKEPLIGCKPTETLA